MRRADARRAGIAAGLVALVFGLLFGSRVTLQWLYDLALVTGSGFDWIAPVVSVLGWPWWIPPWYGFGPAPIVAGFGPLAVAAVVTYVLTTRLLVGRELEPRRMFWLGWVATVIGAGVGGLAQGLVSYVTTAGSPLPSSGLWVAAYAVLWGMVVGLFVGWGVRIVVLRGSR